MFNDEISFLVDPSNGNIANIISDGTYKRLVVSVGDSINSLPAISGTVTANIGTSGSLALDATLTGGTQKAIVRGGAKGTTTAADVTSTSQSADRQALDVQIRTSSGAAIDSFWQATQPISGSVTANIGTSGSLALDATLTGGTQKAIVRGGAKGATTAADVTSTAQSADRQALDVQIRTSSGAAIDSFWQATQPVSIASSVAVTGTFWQATQPVSGSVTANIGTSGSLALDATLTGGTQKAIVRGGAKGATTAADVTSTAQSADRQALDVQIRTSAGAAVDTFGGGTQYADGAARGTATGTIAMGDDGTNIQAISVDNTGKQNINNISGTVSLPTGAATSALQTTGNTSLSNIDGKLGSLGQKAMAGSAPVVIASDQSAISTIEKVSSTATLTNVSASASSVTLIALNTSRLGAVIYNDSNATLYLKYGSAASTTSFTYLIPRLSLWEMPTRIYTGIITGIWSAATGTARVTELS